MIKVKRSKALDGLKPGSAAYVIAHAAWQASRGRKPSLGFGWTLNPMKALKLAMIARRFQLSSKERAEYWLGVARGQDKIDVYAVKWVHENLKNADSVAEDIGTNEAELVLLEKRAYRISAERELAQSRSKPTNYNLAAHLTHCVAEAGITLADLDTDEDEVAELERKAYKYWAVFNLTEARKPEQLDIHKLDQVPEYVSKAGLLLEDIGTDEDEITELMKKIRRASAEYWLAGARDPGKGNLTKVEWLLRDIRAAGITLEDIGTSKEELEGLVEMYASRV